MGQNIKVPVFRELKRSDTSSNAVAPTTSASTGRRKVLIVDDSAVIRNQMRGILSGKTYEVVEAEDGLDGFSKLEEHPDISLMFCDVNMPILDGLDLVEKIKGEGARFAHVSIVMLTTENTSDKVLRAKAAGIKGWIIKPPIPEHILKIVEKLIA